MPGNSGNVSTKQQRIAERARRSPQRGFTSLAYLMDIDWLREAFYRTRKDGAPGVDGQTWAEYAKNLEANLQSLLDRAKSGTYRAPPVRRVHIPKAGSATETRPIGIPTLEDKVLQRAIVMLLEPIYEQDFHASSYGFRRGRSAHQALKELRKQTMASSGGWILEVDIRANLFLHYVLDEWFQQEVLPRLRGHAHLIRYADDFVIVFTREDDARRVREVQPKRFGRYGLTLHPEKTRLVRFHRLSTKVVGAESDRPERRETFDFLGFTHYWGRTRRGGWAVKQKTASKRLCRAVRSIAQWCRQNRHLSIAEQHALMSQKVRGHYAYYGITGNARALAEFLWLVERVWRKWLNRRNHRRAMTWERFYRLLRRYRLPQPRILHSFVT
jgi:retron-type reverse transcriptase